MRYSLISARFPYAKTTKSATYRNGIVYLSWKQQAWKVDFDEVHLSISLMTSVHPITIVSSSNSSIAALEIRYLLVYFVSISSC